MIHNTEENLKKLDNYLKSRKEIPLDIVDFSKTLAINNGVKLKKSKNIEKLQQIIPQKKHTLFILLDGFGYYKLNKLPDSSILKQHFKMKLRTVNPTSTACVLTSLVSAMYPIEHGILGWWNYSKERSISYYPILFQERKNEQLLQEKGIETKDIFCFDSIFSKFNKKVNIYERLEIINSEYSKMFSKNCNRHGFYSVKEAFTSIDKNLQNERKDTFNYLYIDGLDLMSHLYGINSKEANDIIYEVEEGIKLLLNNHLDISVVLTADHGQVDMTSMIYLNQKNDYLKYFYALPSMDTRMISFFVKEEHCSEFEETFSNEFYKDVILLTKDQAIKYELFGKEKLSNKIDDAIGEYVAIVVNNKFMICDKITLEDKVVTIGNHSGLTQEETTIPLVVI